MLSFKILSPSSLLLSWLADWDPSWDPAVVTTGNVSHHDHAQQNGGDEPHWMGYLRNLTEEPAAASAHALPHHHQTLPPPPPHKLLNSAAMPAGFMAPSGVVTPPPPPPGFQLPVRTAAHPLADSFQ